MRINKSKMLQTNPKQADGILSAQSQWIQLKENCYENCVCDHRRQRQKVFQVRRVSEQAAFLIDTQAGGFRDGSRPLAVWPAHGFGWALMQGASGLTRESAARIMKITVKNTILLTDTVNYFGEMSAYEAYPQ